MIVDASVFVGGRTGICFNKDFRPKIVHPYHYQGQNPQVFADALKGEKGITVRMRNMYMDPAK